MPHQHAQCAVVNISKTALCMNQINGANQVCSGLSSALAGSQQGGLKGNAHQQYFTNIEKFHRYLGYVPDKF